MFGEWINLPMEHFDFDFMLGSLYSYEKYTNSEGKTLYATVGYTTIYLYYAYPEHIRPRISQMLVLPPFQKLGIGSKMIEVSGTRTRLEK